MRIYKRRYLHGQWVNSGWVQATVTNYSSYSRYSAKVKLPSAGRWCLQGHHVADVDQFAVWGKGIKYVTVK